VHYRYHELSADEVIFFKALVSKKGLHLQNVVQFEERAFPYCCAGTHPWLVRLWATFFVLFAGPFNLAINMFESTYLRADTLVANASSVFLIMIAVLFHVVGRRMQRQ